MKFNHNISPVNGYHPDYPGLVLFEIEWHYGSYILSAPGYEGTALISSEDAKIMFEDQLDAEFAYLTDEYLQILE